MFNLMPDQETQQAVLFIDDQKKRTLVKTGQIVNS